MRFEASTTYYWDEDPQCLVNFLILTNIETNPAYGLIDNRGIVMQQFTKENLSIYVNK